MIWAPNRLRVLQSAQVAMAKTALINANYNLEVSVTAAVTPCSMHAVYVPAESMWGV